MALMRRSTAEEPRTMAKPSSREMSTSVTPGTSLIAFSTAAWQWVQLMPLIFKLTKGTTSRFRFVRCSQEHRYGFTIVSDEGRRQYVPSSASPGQGPALLPRRAALWASAGLTLHPGRLRPGDFPPQPGDVDDGDVLRARGLAFAVVGATAEAFHVQLIHHADGPDAPFQLTLRQQRQLAHLGADEQGSRRVRARRDTGAAADARCGVHL